MRKRLGFTLVELLVVISIIALLMAILLPVLGRVKEQARSIVCRYNLKTLSLANETYVADCDGWYVPAVDFTMAAMGQPTWNSNRIFRRAIALQSAYDEFFQMPKEYLCPTDRATGRHKNIDLEQYPNVISYGYNFTDWGTDSHKFLSWSGDIPGGEDAAQTLAMQVRRPAEKLMFIDSGDIWVEKLHSSYKDYWDKFGHNLQLYRQADAWRPTFYRHREGANIAFFDNHVEYREKEGVFHYLPGGLWPDHKNNNRLWYIDRSNFQG